MGRSGGYAVQDTYSAVAPAVSPSAQPVMSMLIWLEPQSGQDSSTLRLMSVTMAGMVVVNRPEALLVSLVMNSSSTMATLRLLFMAVAATPRSALGTGLRMVMVVLHRTREVKKWGNWEWH